MITVHWYIDYFLDLKKGTKNICSRTLNRCSSTSFTLQRSCPICFPHHRVPLTHSATATFLLGFIPIYISHTHPPTSRPSRVGADSPLGVVLAGLKGERLAWVEECDIQDLPAQWAVGGKDPSGANPELDQEIWLEGWSHPGVVEVWWSREGGCLTTLFLWIKHQHCVE